MKIIKDKYRHTFPPRDPNHDYSRPSFYFVTICTYQKPGTTYHPSYLAPRRDRELGQSLITDAWDALPRYQYHHNLIVDECVIMPNHVHFLIELIQTEKRGIQADEDDP